MQKRKRDGESSFLPLPGVTATARGEGELTPLEGKKMTLKLAQPSALPLVMHYLVIAVAAFITLLPARLDAAREETAPSDFTLETIDGNQVRLHDYLGKKMVHLLFWATWCPHCLKEMPKVRSLHDALGNKPYEILAIDVGVNDTTRRIRKIQKDYRVPCTILIDEKGKVAKSFRVIGVPCHIIISKEGTIIDRFSELPEDTGHYLTTIIKEQNRGSGQ